MKANELRIGNLIYNNYKEEKYVVGTSYNKIMYTSSMGNFTYNECYDFDCEPIPLTEDWLLKFGFEKYDGWDDMIFWFKEKDENNMCRFALIETQQGYEIETTEKICKFVHELQNCYYFHELTGEELIINENL